MVTTDPYEGGAAQETRKDFTANDFRITRALDSLLTSAKSIKGDIARACMRCDISQRRCDTTCERHDRGRPTETGYGEHVRPALAFLAHLPPGGHVGNQVCDSRVS